MTESIYKEYENSFYNPDDNDKKPGDNDNWRSIQKGFSLVEKSANEVAESIIEEMSDIREDIGDLQYALGIKPPVFQQIGGASFGSGTFAAHTTVYQEIDTITNIDVLKSYLRRFMDEQTGAILLLVPGDVYNLNYMLDISPVFTYTATGTTHAPLINLSNLDQITGIAWRISNRTDSAYTISDVFGGASIMVGFVKLTL